MPAKITPPHKGLLRHQLQRLITIKAVAEHYNVHRETVIAWMNQCGIKQVGRKWVYQ